MESWSCDGKISDEFLQIIASINHTYKINQTYYTNGPGSHMATKLTYLMLKTFEISDGTRCNGISGFECNSNNPIKAMGNLYFVKEKETIITKKIDEQIESKFVLPVDLANIKQDLNSEPFHLLPSV